MQTAQTPTSENETDSPLEAGMPVAQVETGEGSPAGTAGPDPARGTRRHEFRELSFFSPGELRKLRIRHEDFIASLSARLSMRLGLEVVLQMAKLETVPLQKFIEGLSNPTHLSMLKVEPLRGTCLLDIPARLALCIVDRELGGPAACPEEPRELNKLEAQLAAGVVENMAAEWCGVWSGLLELRPAVTGHESNGRFLELSAPDTTMLVLGIDTRIGETVEQIQFAFPHFALEPLMAKLNATREAGEKPAAAATKPPLKWNPALDEVEVELKAELPDLETTAGDLARLKPGDLLLLPRELGSQVRIRVANTPRFVATLGTSEGRWAAQIAQVIRP